MNPQDFDPDEFVLTKQDVTDFIDIVVAYWGRDIKSKIQNIKLIGGLDVMKLGIKFTDENDFKVIWSMLLTFISQLQYENALASMQSKGGDFNWGETVSKLKSDLRNGGLEKMMRKYQK